MQSSTLVLVALVPLIGWRVYSRVRRSIGRQRSRAWRHWTAVIVFPLLVALLGVAASASMPALEALAAGLVAGAGLGAWGLRLTRFERSEKGSFYTPNAYLGVAIAVLFVARIAWRFFELQAQGGAGAHPDFTRSPLTLLVFGVLAGYYTVYAAGLLRWRRSLGGSVAAS